MPFIAPLIALAGKVPWQVWLVIAMLMTNPLSYCKGKSDGKQVILERLEAAQVEATEKAEKASEQADENQGTAAIEFEAQQDILKKVITDAKANDSNPLDAVFGGMSETD